MEKHTNEGGVNIKDLFICSFITFRKGVKVNAASVLLMDSQNKISLCTFIICFCPAMSISKHNN